MIEHEGYVGVSEFDPTIDAFHGRVLGLRDVVTFEGRSVDELRDAMAESVEDYLEFCASVGKEPEKPYRGEFLVRTTPEVHRAAAVEAEAVGLSLNAWVEAAISRAVEKARPADRAAKRREGVAKARRPRKERV